MQTTNIHPVFADILAMFSRQPEVIAECALHRPLVGNAARAYRSLGDAMAYESGYMAYDHDKAMPMFRTPFADGWADAADDAKAGAQ